ncbi:MULTISPECIES: hypothetical protein [Paenibacillus]|uniref:hypothetical protein n=1 Tax=Paenibacillus TaxID=44249 RepID=UPI0022B92BA8|nr:hypothetical protein [Paenibacillus caseinilyticus]MCZ8521154.1 hypothetical protein [Paenibacillus caseinilyticus]
MATKRWRTAACGLLMLLLLPAGADAEAAPPAIIRPDADTRQDSFLNVEVAASGVESWSRMTASVDGRGIDLVRVCPETCSWVGSLDLRGLPKGPRTLTVEPTGAAGAGPKAEQPFFYVPSPYLLTTPAPLTTLTSLRLPVRIVPYGYLQDPAAMEIRGSVSTSEGETLAEFQGQGRIDQAVELQEAAGPELLYRVNVLDEQRNVLHEQLHLLHYEPSEAIAEAERAPGEIVDFGERRILYRGEANALVLRERNGGGDAVVLPAGLGTVELAALTPNGAAAVVQGTESRSLYVWRDHRVEAIRDGIGERVEVRGAYVLFDEGDGLTRSILDTSTGSLRTFDGSLYREGVLTEDGGLLYVSEGAISRLHPDGTVTEVLAGAGEAAGLLSDGDRILFRAGDRLMRYDGSRLQELAGELSGTLEAHKAYESRGGWAAYLSGAGDGATQAVLLPPQGKAVQAELPFGGAEIAGLGEDGTMFLRGGGKLWRLLPGEAQVQETASDRGSLKELGGGRWHKALGDTLFAVREAGGISGPLWPAGDPLSAAEVGPDAAVLQWLPAIGTAGAPSGPVRGAEKLPLPGGGVTGGVYGSAGIAEYRIYRDGELQGAVPGGVNRYRAEGLRPGTTYEFSVEARDASGRFTTDNPKISVTTGVYGPEEASGRIALTKKAGRVVRGSEVELQVRAAEASDLYGFHLKLQYDPARFKLTGAALGSGFGQASSDAVLGRSLKGETASFAGVLLGPTPGRSGEIGLLTLKFRALQPGTGEFSVLPDTALTDSGGRTGILEQPVRLKVTVE